MVQINYNVGNGETPTRIFIFSLANRGDCRKIPIICRIGPHPAVRLFNPYAYTETGFMDTEKYDALDETGNNSADNADRFSTAETMTTSRHAPRKRMHKPRGFKIALLIVAVLFVLFAAVLYFLPHFLPMDAIRGIAQTKAREMLGMDLNFRNLRFSWSGNVVLDGITLSPIAENGEAGDPLLTIDEVSTSVAVSPLLSGNIIINSVDVNGFSVRVRRSADGSLNLPDFDNLAALPDTRAATRRARLSTAVAADAADAALPPIEIHRVSMKNGILGLEDAVENRELAFGLEYLTIEGQGLDDPFVFSGLFQPYPGQSGKGDLPFTGRAALLKNGQFNPNGEAALEINVRSFAFHDLAAQFGLGDLLANGEANGLVKAALADGKALLSIPDFQLSGIRLGLGDATALPLPDAALAMNATFDPAADVVSIADMSASTALFSAKAKGWAKGVNEIADGLLPAVSIEYTGMVDFAKTAALAPSFGVDASALPRFDGAGGFFGKLLLEKQTSRDQALEPSFSLDFNDGNLAVRDDATGMGLDLVLTGVGAKATALLADPIDVNAGLDFQTLRASVTIPQLTDAPVAVTLNGGIAATIGLTAGVEMRLQNTLVAVPPTGFSGAVHVTNPETRITYDLDQDTLAIDALDFTVNDSMRGSVSSGAFTGIAQGRPRGQADIAFSTVMESLAALFQPLVPDFAAKLAGTVNANTRVRFDGEKAEALVKADMENIDVGVVLPEAQAAVTTPTAAFGLLASASISNPLVVTLSALEVDTSDAVLQMARQAGESAAGRFGTAAIKAAGVLDLGDGMSELSNLSITGNGMAIAFGQNGRQVAGLESGVMQIIAARPEAALSFPIGGDGNFALPAMDAGMDNLRFYLLNGEQRDVSDFGNLRARIGVDGSIGVPGNQIINLHTAAFSAKPLAVNSRGQFNLDTGGISAAYAARVAPIAMGSLLDFLNLPPALLRDLNVSGSVSLNGDRLDSKGTGQMQVQLASGEVNQVEMNHDISAALDSAAHSLALSIRTLDGTVKTAQGESVVTLASQQSDLLLSRAGSKGLIDIRANGAAEPTRTLAAGLAGIFPQLREYAEMLHDSQANGKYNAWLQISEKGANTLALNLGGVWQGAAVTMNRVPYLAETGNLSAALEGEFAYRDNRIGISRLMFRSDSGQVQADGTAQAVLSTDQNNSINGLDSVNLDLRFVVADAAKLPAVFPGVVSADTGLAGKIDGQFKIGGNTNDIRVEQGLVAFQGFQVVPGGTKLSIPSGSANFGANIALQLNAGASGAPPSPYDAFTLFTVRNGQATLTGAEFQDRPINAMSASFELQGGILALNNAQFTVEGNDGAAAMASGTVDFNSAAPVVNLQAAVRNFPLAEVNPEIEEFMTIESGVFNLPSSGQAARITFRGFSEDEILATLRLDNFNFATSPIVLHTGPKLNAELNTARVILRTQPKPDSEAIIITLKGITGTVTAEGNGRIVIPESNPINVIGDNTGDFRAYGEVLANRTMNINLLIAGKLENLIGFNLPNLIPDLRAGSDEDRRSFMNAMNKYADEGRYKVALSGDLENPALSGIGEVARHFLTDMLRSVAGPGQIIGGVVDLGKDAPGAVLDAAGAILNPDNIRHPENIIKAPVNIGKGLGRVFGLDIGRSEGGKPQE